MYWLKKKHFCFSLMNIKTLLKFMLFSSKIIRALKTTYILTKLKWGWLMFNASAEHAEKDSKEWYPAKKLLLFHKGTRHVKKKIIVLS